MNKLEDMQHRTSIFRPSLWLQDVKAEVSRRGPVGSGPPTATLPEGGKDSVPNIGPSLHEAEGDAGAVARHSGIRWAHGETGSGANSFVTNARMMAGKLSLHVEPSHPFLENAALKHDSLDPD